MPHSDRLQCSKFLFPFFSKIRYVKVHGPAKVYRLHFFKTLPAVKHFLANHPGSKQGGVLVAINVKVGLLQIEENSPSNLHALLCVVRWLCT